MRRSVRVVLAIAAAQAALVGIYWLVEERRSPDQNAEPELSTDPPQEVDGLMQPMSLRARDGSQHELREVDRPTLVHFWATWCPPCRAELPGILALPEKHPFDVVGVALDQDWPDVERFLNGRSPPTVFLGDSSDAERAFGVRTLPVTYLVEPGGRLQLRFDGARDWTDSTFLRTWMEDIGSE